MTDRYAVIGHPVAHSKSPLIHAAFARATGEDLHYGLIEAPLDGFTAAVDAFRAGGGRGLNVTVPFKEAALVWCREQGGAVGARAARAGAVNTLAFNGERLVCDNTDGAGLERDLEVNLEFSLRGRRVLLMGAGGAARGVVQPLLDAGVAELAIANRTAARAQALAEQFAPGVRGGGYAAFAGARFDLVINATSAGLQDAMPELPAGCYAPGALAYDMLYGRETPFLRDARGQGVRVSDGLGMLVEQAAEAFRIWRGILPATAPVLAMLRQAQA